jgi:drug/metabolite transporter (DMT)-like permease
LASPPEDAAQEHAVIAGIVLTIVSAVLYNSGFVVEKQAVEAMPAIHARRTYHLVRTLVSSPRWVAGFTLLLLGLCFQVLALSLAPISVVQPLFLSGMVLLLVLSHIVLRERLSSSETAGVAAVLVAVVLIGLSLDKASDTVGVTNHLGRILVAGAPTAVLAGVVFALASRLPERAAPLFGIAAGLVYGVASLGVKGVSTIVEQHGLAGSVTRVITSPDLYLFVVFSGLGLLMFQTGLQRCRVSVLAPVSNVLSSVYLVAVGTVIFGEHLPADPWRMGLRMGGFAGVVVGMAALARGDALAPGFSAGPAEGVDLGLAAIAEVETESAHPDLG